MTCILTGLVWLFYEEQNIGGKGWMEKARLGCIPAIQARDDHGLIQGDSSEYVLKIDPRKFKVWGLSNYKKISAIY